MKKIDWTSFVFCLLMMSFICAAFVFSSYCNSKNKLANNYYNEFSLRLAVSQNADTFLADLIQAAKSNGNIGFILYDITLCETNGSNAIGVLLSDFNDVPKLSYGRFFEIEDFDEDKKLAVVGYNAAVNIYYKDKVPYIELFDDEYQVIGIMQRYGHYKINDMVYYNLGELRGDGCLFQLDASSKKSITKLINSFASGAFKIIDTEPSAQERIFHYSEKDIYISIALLVGAVLSMYLFINSVFTSEKQAITVYWFLGAKFTLIRKRIIKAVILSAGVPLVILIVIAVLIEYFVPAVFTVCYHPVLFILLGIICQLVVISIVIYSLRHLEKRGIPI